MYKKIALIGLLILLAVSAGTHVGYRAISYDIGSFSVEEEPVPFTTPVHVDNALAFVGDVMLARNVENVQKEYGESYIFDALPPPSSTTVLVGNFESAIAKEHVQTESMKMSFSTPTSSLPALAKYGFRFLSLANNHSYDKGVDNFHYTKNQITATGITPFGDQKVSSTTVVYTEVGGQIIALIGVYAVAGMPDMEALTYEIEIATLQSDMQIAYVHWGTEYELTHSRFQESLARALIDLGIDAIVGHHPHVVQDIAVYDGVPVFYSLGNFVFDQYWMDSVEDGLWVEMRFASSSIEYVLKPVTYQGSRSQPRFMSAYDRDRFLIALADRSNTDLKKQIQEGLLTDF